LISKGELDPVDGHDEGAWPRSRRTEEIEAR
jgi:hypothetical protein